jgi:biotin transporter BioY
MKLKNSKNYITFLREVALPSFENRILVVVKDIVLILGFAILTAAAANIKVEIGQVPITMQTMIVLLTGALLGSKRGTISQFLYLLGGLSGLPWFSRGGGIAYAFSPTFGYILGFLPAAFLVGFLSERIKNENIIKDFFVMLSGNLAIYIPGLLWLSGFVGLSNVLALGFLPFIFGDLLKMILAVSILFLVKKKL